MGLIKTLAVVGGGAYALNELSKQQSGNRSANVAVKNTIDPLAVKEAIAKDPNLLALVRGEAGPQGPTGPQGPKANTANAVFLDGYLALKANPNYQGGKVFHMLQNLDGTKIFYSVFDPNTTFMSIKSQFSGYDLEIMRLNNDGSISKIGGGSFSALSDQRVKDNIQNFQNGLDKILAIETKTFKYKKVAGTQTEFYTDSICNKTQYGVIAQQLKEVCPEMVTEDEQGFYSVDLSNLPLMLVNAVKELSTKLDTVTTNYEALLQRVEALENPPATA